MHPGFLDWKAESGKQRAVCRPYFKNFCLCKIIDHFGEHDSMHPGFFDWKAESREQRAESREQRAESREQRVESRKQFAARILRTSAFVK